MMLNETEDFVEAMEQFVKAELRASMEPADYNNEAIEIIDARNHLFRNVGRQTTDHYGRRRSVHQRQMRKIK